jgi:hypothetical protein
VVPGGGLQPGAAQGACVRACVRACVCFGGAQYTHTHTWCAGTHGCCPTHINPHSSPLLNERTTCPPPHGQQMQCATCDKLAGVVLVEDGEKKEGALVGGLISIGSSLLCFWRSWIMSASWGFHE